MSKTKKLFKDIVFFSGSTIFSNILNFITGFIVRYILQPTLMGLYNEIMLIFDYARSSHLGMLDSLDRELPYFYGRQDTKRIETVKDTGFTICLITSLITSIGLFAASFFMSLHSDRLLVNGIRIVSLLVIIQIAGSLYIVLNRSHNKFSIISRYTILVSILDAGIKIFLVIKFGLYGLLWASVLTAVFGLIYLYKTSVSKFRFILDFSRAEGIRLFKIGFPIFVMGFVCLTLRNIDRIMIIRLMDRQNLGFYTIALMASAYIVQLPNLVYAVIFPRFYQAYGEKQNILATKDIFMKPIHIFAYLFPILIGLAILIMPILVQYILPTYIPGIMPACLLLLGSSFIALVNMPGYLLIALDKQIKIILIATLCIFLGAAVIYMLVRKFNLGLIGIAIGTSIAYFTYTTILIVYAFKNYTKKIKSHIKFLIELYIPFFWVAIALLIVHAFVFGISGAILKDSLVVFLKGIFFILICLPLIWHANRKTGVLALVKAAYFKKI